MSNVASWISALSDLYENAGIIDNNYVSPHFEDGMDWLDVIILLKGTVSRDFWNKKFVLKSLSVLFCMGAGSFLDFFVDCKNQLKSVWHF